MIDKLNLTTFLAPDKEYLEAHGVISENMVRNKIYRFLCRLPEAVVFYLPHKFSDPINATIPFCKIDINPKYFTCYDHMAAYLASLFEDSDEISSSEFRVSRLDIAADVEDICSENLLSVLRIKEIRSNSLSFFKGTIYAGSNPKIRVYDKKKEIIARLKKRGDILTEYEKGLLNSVNNITRFEVQIRNVKKSLKDLSEDPVSLVSYFDRLEFFNFTGEESSGVLQYLYRFINRKYRRELEELKNTDLLEIIKNKYIEQVTDWFASKEPF